MGPPGESPRCRGPAQDLAVAEPRRETDTSLPLAEDSGPSVPAGPEDGTGGASTAGPPPTAAPLCWGAPPPGSCWAPAPQTPSPRGSPSVSRVSRAHSITRALWGLLCLLHAPGTPKNGLVSVSYSTTQEAAAPRPPQDPHVLAGPALRTPEAQAAWGPAVAMAVAVAALLVVDCAPPRVNAQAPHTPAFALHRKMFLQPGRQHFCGRSQMFLAPLDRTHDGSFRGSCQFLSSTLNPCWTPG